MTRNCSQVVGVFLQISKFTANSKSTARTKMEPSKTDIMLLQTTKESRSSTHMGPNHGNNHEFMSMNQICCKNMNRMPDKRTFWGKKEKEVFLSISHQVLFMPLLRVLSHFGWWRSAWVRLKQQNINDQAENYDSCHEGWPDAANLGKIFPHFFTSVLLSHKSNWCPSFNWIILKKKIN